MGSQWRRLGGFPKVPLGFRRLRRPGSMVPSGLRPWAPWVPPTERAGSEGAFEAAFRRENRKTAPQARFYGFASEASQPPLGGYKLRPQGAAIPFEPSEPSEPSEPELRSSSMAPPQPSRRQARQTLEPLRPQGASNFGPEGAVKPEKRAARRPSFHICSTSLNALI